MYNMYIISNIHPLFLLRKVAKARMASPVVDDKEPVEGGFDCEFVEGKSLPKWFQANCPVCLLILREPHQATCCGKVFCKICIEKVKFKNNPCPCCCKMEEYQIFHNLNLQQTLYNEFKVYCSNRKHGCEWVGYLRDIDSHLNLEPLQEKELDGCQFSQVECSYCSKSYLRSKLQVHKNKDCFKRPFSCKYCKDFNATYGEVTFHWSECGFFPILCPRKCGVTLERQLLDKHCAEDCPETIVDCDFKLFGCDMKLPRRDLATHISESLIQHMRPMLQVVARLEVENKQLKEEVARLHASTPTIALYLKMYDLENHIREGSPWVSPSFYFQGYKLRLQVYVSNDGETDNICTTIFICLMLGRLDEHLKWPFRGTVVVELLKESGGVIYTAKIDHEGQRPTGNISFGRGVSHVHTNLKKHIKNDRLHFRIPAVISDHYTQSSDE